MYIYAVMNTVRLLFCLFVVFDKCLCMEQNCTGNGCIESINIQLMDKLEAPLKAELDITALNKQLRTLIKAEVTKAMRELVHGIIANELDELEQKLMSNNSIKDSDLQRNIHGRDSDLQRSIHVAFTSCSFDNSAATKGTVIKFNDIKTAYGIKDISQFVSSGIFICKHPGLYQIIATVKTHTNRASYGIYKNDSSVISGFVAEHSGRDKSSNYDHSGTTVVMVVLNTNETISVKATVDLYLHSETCLSIVKF